VCVRERERERERERVEWICDCKKCGGGCDKRECERVC
jgi:hypothetical protein